MLWTTTLETGVQLTPTARVLCKAIMNFEVQLIVQGLALSSPWHWAS